MYAYSALVHPPDMTDNRMMNGLGARHAALVSWGLIMRVSRQVWVNIYSERRHPRGRSHVVSPVSTLK